MRVCIRTSTDSVYSGLLEASGAAVHEWLLSPAFEARLFSFFPCTNLTPSRAKQVQDLSTENLLVCGHGPDRHNTLIVRVSMSTHVAHVFIPWTLRQRLTGQSCA